MCLLACLVVLVGRGHAGPASTATRLAPATPARDVVRWTSPGGLQALIGVAPSRRSLRFYGFADGRPLALAGERPAGEPRFSDIRALARSGDLLFIAEPEHVRILRLPALDPVADLRVKERHPDDMSVRRLQGGGYRILVGQRGGAPVHWLRRSQADWPGHP